MSLIGKNVEEQIWNFLKSKGLNDYGAASLMGNLYAESGLNSKNLENTGNTKLGMTDDEYTRAVDNGTYTKDQFIHDGFGYSLPQWTWHQRKKNYYEYAKSKNKSVGDLETALEFLYKELSENYKSVLTTLKNAKSVKEASNAVLLKFECPADQSVSVQNKRAYYGQNYYNKYANKGDGKMAYTKGVKVKLSNNFNSTEFDCHGSGCCSTTEIDPKLVEYLQKIRDHFNAPVTINSAYRCEKHNAKIGGASKSKHKYGQAADIVVKGVAPAEVAKYAESIGIKGIGLYSSFVHIDTRTTKSFWYGHEQAYRSTFGGIVKVETVEYTLEQFVRDIQKSCSLPVNGKADLTTLSKTITISNTINRSHKVIKFVQKRLLALGYNDVGNPDGIAGEMFKNALINFQKANGCTPTGIAEEEGRTWKKLLGLN